VIPPTHRVRVLTILTLSGLSLLSSRHAFAQMAEAPPDRTYADARTGFQAGIRLSAQIPAGNLEPGVTLASLLGPRVHLAFDLGSKVSPYFFVGGYIGMSYGLEGSSFSEICGATDSYGDGASCQAESADGGLVLIATLAPSRLVDPWVGVTVGYEVQGLNYAGASGLLTGVSPTLLTGVDFRIRNREHKGLLSVGPYVGLTAQKYLTASLDGMSIDPSGGPFHAWLHFGLRLTFPS